MKKEYKTNKKMKKKLNARETKPSSTSRFFVNLIHDLIFKTYFTKNEKALLSLLETFLPLTSGQKIERVDILNPHTLPDKQGKKEIILDLKLKLNNKEKINVEMQSTQKKDFLSRVLFYWAKLYTEDLKSSANRW